MEDKLKEALGVEKLVATGYTSGGCISQGMAYDTENGKIFVKTNSKSQTRRMFEGEFASLNAILSTNTVKAPKPLAVFDSETGSNLVLEFLDMSSLRKHAGKLGQQLAKMHLHNETLKTGSSSNENAEDMDTVGSRYIEEFGFHTTTCCGYLPMDNTWKKDWVEFYTQQRLGSQIQLIESEYGDRLVRELWPKVQLKIPELFKDITITPALLHGDLWSGNVAETTKEPVIFDPAAFYGHSEFELAISEMFGKFPTTFYEAYHRLIPKADGFDKRKLLYQLFHYLNHWNHFGVSYRSSCTSIMKKLV